MIATYDGADVVMPNGDLLNSHLSNWSLAGNRKRSSLIIGIAYDSHLDEVKKLLLKILAAEERILKIPTPIVQFEQFNNFSIDLRIFFWAKNMRDSASVKSDLIMSITNAFAEHHISIPYPQQEIYLHNQTLKP